MGPAWGGVSKGLAEDGRVLSAEGGWSGVGLVLAVNILGEAGALPPCPPPAPDPLVRADTSQSSAFGYAGGGAASSWLRDKCFELLQVGADSCEAFPSECRDVSLLPCGKRVTLKSPLAPGDSCEDWPQAGTWLGPAGSCGSCPPCARNVLSWRWKPKGTGFPFLSPFTREAARALGSPPGTSYHVHDSVDNLLIQVINF